MPSHRSIINRLSVFVAERSSRSLSTGIAIVMCVGLLLPALVGSMALTRLNQTRMEIEQGAYLDDKVALLANSLANPVWNYDTMASEAIVDTLFRDAQVVRVTIAVTEPAPSIFLNAERPIRRMGQPRIARHDLLRGGKTTGHVEVEVDDGLSKQRFEEDRRAYSFILLGQFILAFALILTALRYWVIKPLAQLTAVSNQLSSGNFEHQFTWDRPDEIGRLANQLDHMRNDLRSSFAEQQAILNNIQVGVVFSREGTIQLANRHAEKIFGYGEGMMRGITTRDLCLSDDQYRAIEAHAEAELTSPEGRYEEELCLQRRDGSSFWAQLRGCKLASGNQNTGSIWVYEDISLRRAAENEINSLAFYDPLTKLPNRRLLRDRLKQALISSARNEKRGALLFIDLDNFKTLNDSLGHDIGDILLQQVAQRLTACVRKDDTVSRLGGDEFVVMLEDLSPHQEVAASQAEFVVEKILAALNKPYDFANTDHRSTASIGVTLFEDNTEGIEEQLKRADLAMYQAKAAGRNTMRFFNSAMQTAVAERAALEGSLHEAIEKEQLRLHYQAQVDGNARITGVEALLRWNHAERGMVPPNEFIPLAEETGLILPLGQWVLNTACRQLAAWAERPEMAHLSIAINVSARQFHREDFVSQVLEVIKQTGADPSLIKLELTESLLITNIEDVIEKMHALKKIGVGFSLDDFGTGYSSLSYLKRLPLDQLKIDQGFVRDILVDSDDVAISKMIVALAEGLGLSVIAEGVETEAQRALLAHQGCHAYQGYLFSRPVPLDEFERLVANAS